MADSGNLAITIASSAPTKRPRTWWNTSSKIPCAAASSHLRSSTPSGDRGPPYGRRGNDPSDAGRTFRSAATRRPAI